MYVVHLKAKVRFEWIDSESNPADGLSRAGLADEWTLRQPWQCTDLGDRDWSSAFTTDPTDAAAFS